MADQIKDAINQRFIEAIDLLIERKLFKSRSSYGLLYDIKPATISDWKYGRSHVDLRHMYNMGLNYPFISLEYIILGNGDLLKPEEKSVESDEENKENTVASALTLENLEKRIKDLEETKKGKQK